MSTLWNRNFTMVVIGQIISIFGNAILRFALPLYLLNQTGSAALFGAVSAFLFIPVILLAPIGGIFADRVNKRNIMVVLDFATALIILVLMILLGKVNLVVLLLITMVLLYGIQGAYQPSVQASIPVLLAPEHIMQGNAAINLVNSFSGLLGPVIGGILFSFVGIKPILLISSFCFLASAIMEIFIQIPFIKKETNGTVLQVGIRDLKESFHYMGHTQPLIIHLSLIVAGINLVISAFIIIGLPVIITQILPFETDTASRLYGYAQGALAAGGLLGGILAGALSKKLKAKSAYRRIIACAFSLFPMGLALILPLPALVSYGIIVISCFFMMVAASLLSIQLMAYLQMIVPKEMLGKVISCAICIGMCASPLGQTIYGGLFQIFREHAEWILFAAMIITCIFALTSKNIFQKLSRVVKED